MTRPRARPVRYSARQRNHEPQSAAVSAHQSHAGFRVGFTSADLGGYRVQVYDKVGNYIRTVGKYGDNYGEFARLKGVAIDRDNLLYAVDAAGQMVQILMTPAGC